MTILQYVYSPHKVLGFLGDWSYINEYFHNLVEFFWGKE